MISSWIQILFTSWMMRSRRNQSGPQGWLCVRRFLRILLWPWCGPLSISNKIFSIGIKTINHTPSTSFTRRRDGCVCQKLVRASCSRLMCLPIRPCQPLRSWQSSLIRNPWPRVFLQLTSLHDRLLHGQARRSSLQHARRTNCDLLHRDARLRAPHIRWQHQVLLSRSCIEPPRSQACARAFCLNLNAYVHVMPSSAMDPPPGVSQHPPRCPLL